MYLTFTSKINVAKTIQKERILYIYVSFRRVVLEAWEYVPVQLILKTSQEYYN